MVGIFVFPIPCRLSEHMNDSRVECHFDILIQLIDETGAESSNKMFEQREIMAGTETHSRVTLKETNVYHSVLLR